MFSSMKGKNCSQIKHIENILTKDIYSMPAEKADSIGDDNINATDFRMTIVRSL